MKIKVVGKNEPFKKKGSDQYLYIAYIEYSAQKVEGIKAEAKFFTKDLFDSLQVGKEYNLGIDFRGFIQSVESIK